MFAGFLGTCAFPHLPCERTWPTANLPIDRKLDLLSHCSHVEAGGRPPPPPHTCTHVCKYTQAIHFHVHTHTHCHPPMHTQHSVLCTHMQRTDTHRHTLGRRHMRPQKPRPPANRVSGSPCAVQGAGAGGEMPDAE